MIYLPFLLYRRCLIFISPFCYTGDVNFDDLSPLSVIQEMFDDLSPLSVMQEIVDDLSPLSVIQEMSDDLSPLSVIQEM
jgi:hypothetical protein